MNILAHNSSLQQTELEIILDPAKPALTKTFLVSVIIPVYNSSKYIQKAIESVLAQTYSNYEIIVVDDGSTDNTKAILEQYKDKIHYIYQENQGSAAARNTGIKLAQGELVAFLDADDLWSMPEKLEKQVACFAADPDLGGVNTGWRIIDGAGKHLKTVQPWHKAPTLDLETWLKKKCVRTSAMIFRREWLEKVGGFDPEIRQSHDVDLILRLSLAGCKTRWLKEETVCYRQHGENTTKDSLKQAKYVQAVLDKFYARSDLPESIRKQEQKVRYHTLVWIAWYQYDADNLDAMASYLQKSLNFSPYLRAENISHWLTSFKRFSLDRGRKFEVNTLTNSFQWQQVVADTFKLTNETIAKTKQGIETAKRRGEKEDIASYSNDIETINSEVISLGQTKQIPFERLKRNVDIYNSTSALPIKNNSNKDIKSSLEHQSQLDAESIVKDNYLTADRYLKLGEKFEKEKQLDQAIFYYKKALELQPDYWNIHYRLGRVYFKKKLWQHSIARYQKSIELNADFLWSYYNLARNYEQTKQYEQAISNYIKALDIEFKAEIKRDLEYLINQRISFYRQQGDKKGDDRSQELIKIKQKLLLKEIEFKSNEFQKYKNLGDASTKAGRLDDALGHYKKAIEILPHSWSIHQKCAHILLKQSKWQDSIDECYKVIELNPNYLWSYYNLARNLTRVGNWHEAIDNYLKALKISNKPEIREKLESLLDEKIAYYQKNMQLEAKNLIVYQELLDLKGKLKVESGVPKKRSKGIVEGFGKRVKKRKKVLCLMLGMKEYDFTESINLILYQMHKKEIYPIILTDSVETELLLANDVIFEYFPLSEVPFGITDREWKSYLKDRVSSLVKEWSPQQVLNFSHTLNHELSHILLSID